MDPLSPNYNHGSGSGSGAKANKRPLIRKPCRIRYDKPTISPKLSLHWEKLVEPYHQPNDDTLIYNLQELCIAFQDDLKKDNVQRENEIPVVALWSTICGYCEALTTHQNQEKRFGIFPIPLGAIRRMVRKEFVIDFCQQQQQQQFDEDILRGEEGERNDKNDKTSKKKKKGKHTDNNTNEETQQQPPEQKQHRELIRQVSNQVWKKAHNKSKDIRDELHANNFYVWLRGSIDGKSLDCFGSALVTITSINQILRNMMIQTERTSRTCTTSYLTLSEDHAYESHSINITKNNATTATAAAEGEGDSGEGGGIIMSGTCEIAYPGKGKDIQQKRGKSIHNVLEDKSKSKSSSRNNNNNNKPNVVTPETSWTYMHGNAVVCTDVTMVLAAVIGNINCVIGGKENDKKHSQQQQQPLFVSASLMDLKRELLWILYDGKYLDKFPFALMELAECEEYRTTHRGYEWVNPGHGRGIITSSRQQEQQQHLVLAVEKLYLDAMYISRSKYGDSQTYPYFCAGHYHKDSVWEEEEVVLEDHGAAAAASTTAPPPSSNTTTPPTLLTTEEAVAAGEDHGTATAAAAAAASTTDPPPSSNTTTTTTVTTEDAAAAGEDHGAAVAAVAASSAPSYNTTTTKPTTTKTFFNPKREYRLVEAVRLYSEASRVASKYRYHSESMQLMKHMTKVSQFILDDILTLPPQQQQQQQNNEKEEEDGISSNNNEKKKKHNKKQQRKERRVWDNVENEIATGTWLIAFFDSLLFWEEKCGNEHFVDILSHDYQYGGIFELFRYLSFEARQQILERIFPAAATTTITPPLPQPPQALPPAQQQQPQHDTQEAKLKEHEDEDDNGRSSKGAAAVVGVSGGDGGGCCQAITENNLLYFSKPRSKRLQKDSPFGLVYALLGPEQVKTRDMETKLAFVMSDNQSSSSSGGRPTRRGTRAAKKPRIY